ESGSGAFGSAPTALIHTVYVALRARSRGSRPLRLRCRSQLLVVFGKQASPLGLGEAAPDAVRFAYPQCEFEAVLANGALRTDVLRVLVACLAVVATFRCRRWEEHRRFGSATRRAQMPSLVNKAQCHAYS